MFSSFANMATGTAGYPIGFPSHAFNTTAIITSASHEYGRPHILHNHKQPEAKAVDRDALHWLANRPAPHNRYMFRPCAPSEMAQPQNDVFNGFFNGSSVGAANAACSA
jgi:hypothetical protein